jgi:hypothetical protein
MYAQVSELCVCGGGWLLVGVLLWASWTVCVCLAGWLTS